MNECYEGMMSLKKDIVKLKDEIASLNEEIARLKAELSRNERKTRLLTLDSMGWQRDSEKYHSMIAVLKRLVRGE